MKPYQKLLEYGQDLIAFRSSLIDQLDNTKDVHMQEVLLDCIDNIDQIFFQLFYAYYENVDEVTRNADFGEFTKIYKPA